MALSELQWPFPPEFIPLRDGYSAGMADNTIRTDFDTGTPRVRKRSSAGMKARSMTYYMSAEQKKTMEVFFELSEGRSFWWQDPVSKNWKYVRLKTKDVDKLFTPAGGGYWEASLVFEVWPYVTR